MRWAESTKLQDAASLSLSRARAASGRIRAAPDRPRARPVAGRPAGTYSGAARRDRRSAERLVAARATADRRSFAGSCGRRSASSSPAVRGNGHPSAPSSANHRVPLGPARRSGTRLSRRRDFRLVVFPRRRSVSYEFTLFFLSPPSPRPPFLLLSFSVRLSLLRPYVSALISSAFSSAFCAPSPIPAGGPPRELGMSAASCSTEFCECAARISAGRFVHVYMYTY